MVSSTGVETKVYVDQVVQIPGNVLVASEVQYDPSSRTVGPKFKLKTRC